MPIIINPLLYTTKIKAPDINGLVAHYTMDEGVGNTLHDFSNNGNHGTLINSPAWEDGILGKALRFNGSDTSVSISHKNLDINFNLTISVWIKLMADSGNSVMGIIRNSTNSNANAIQRYSLQIGSNNIILAVVGDGASAVNTINAGVISKNDWHHISWVINKLNENMQVYRNGTLVSNSVQKTVTWAGSSTDVVIGRLAARFFNGLIDDVRIYNRALSQKEITTLYQAGVSKIV